MATPLTATHRFTMSYVVDGFTHIKRSYCKRQDPLIGGPAVLDRNGSLIDVVDAAQGLWDTFSQSLETTVPPPAVLFEERSGSLWLPVAAATVTGSGSSTNGVRLASQYTLVVRDTAFKKIRATWLEFSEAYVGHSPSGLGISTTLDVIANNYNGAGAIANHPFLWEKSRGDNYILASGAIAGGTLDLNDKIKRRRGLE